MVRERLALIARALPAPEREQLFSRRVLQLCHERLYLREWGDKACILLMVNNEDRDPYLVERHRRDRAAPLVGQNAGCQDDAVRRVGTGKFSGDVSDGLGAAAGANQPHRHARLAPQPGNDSLDVRCMLGLLAKTGKKGRALPVRWRVDEHHHQALVGEKLARAHQKVSFAPLQRTVREYLQAAMPAGEHDDCRLRRRRREYRQPLGDAGPRGYVDDRLHGLRACLREERSEASRNQRTKPVTHTARQVV